MKVFCIVILTFGFCLGQLPSEFSKAKTAAEGVKEVTDALAEITNEEGLLKELVNTGKTASFFKNLAAFTGIVGNGFAAVGFFTDIIFGNTQANNFKKVFEKFDQLDQKIDSLRNFADWKFNEVIGATWKAETIGPLATFDTANQILDNFLKNPESGSHQEKVMTVFQTTNLRKSVNSLKRVIEAYSNTNFVKKGKCQELLLEKGNLMAITLKALMAFKIGCVINNKKYHGMNEQKAESDCKTHEWPDLKSNIFDVIDKKIKICKSVDNAKNIVEKMIKKDITSRTSIREAKDIIRDFIKKRFPHLTWMVNVYSPLSGFDKHTTNGDILRFRDNNMNIAVSVMDSCKSYPNCGREECPVYAYPPSRTEQRGSEGGIVGVYPVTVTDQWNANQFHKATVEKLRDMGVSSYRVDVYRNDDGDTWAYWSNSNICVYDSSKGLRNQYRISYIYNP